MEKRYQYSKFLGDNREEQIVIRCDNWEEFKEAGINIGVNVDKIVHPPEEKNEPTKPITKETQKPIDIRDYENLCEKCGSKKGISKAGNPYCLAKCWLKKE